jgi:hypothetical protein
MEWTTQLADQLDWHWQHMFRPGLDGLTDHDDLWEPVPDYPGTDRPLTAEGGLAVLAKGPR